MPHDINAVALFCEDIREEKAGSETLVGVLPDNITVPVFPVGIPKLGVHVRIQIKSGYKPKKIRISIQWPWDGEHPNTVIDPEIIAEAAKKAMEDNAPLFGVISRFQMNNVPLLSKGIIRVIANIDEDEILAGILNVQSAAAGHGD